MVKIVWLSAVYLFLQVQTFSSGALIEDEYSPQGMHLTIGNLNEAAKLSHTLKTNCVTELPEEFSHLRQHFEIIGTIAEKVNELYGSRTDVDLSSLGKTRYYRTMLEDLELISSVAVDKPELCEQKAYKQLEAINRQLKINTCFGRV